MIDSRLTEEGRAVRRRRECPKCQHRFTTFERQELSSLIVVKRDGTSEPYSRSKLERGIWLACSVTLLAEATLLPTAEMWAGLPVEFATAGQ